jgi:hypothetical protein
MEQVAAIKMVAVIQRPLGQRWVEAHNGRHTLTGSLSGRRCQRGLHLLLAGQQQWMFAIGSR